MVALLSCDSVKDAAAAAGVGERTFHRWRIDPAFCAAYTAAIRQRLSETVGRLRALAGDAVETLRAALGDQHTGHRIRAAVALLDLAVKVEIDDLARRVELLEAAQKTLTQ